jgi:hypothetical protein
MAGEGIAEPPVPYLKATVPTASWETNTVFESAGCTCFACHVRPLSEHPLSGHPLFLTPLPLPHYRYGKKEDHWR